MVGKNKFLFIFFSRTNYFNIHVSFFRTSLASIDTLHEDRKTKKFKANTAKITPDNLALGLITIKSLNVFMH